ncbi:MAG: alpha/beta hydrolase family protein [Halobacteriaceae archaeon]
MDLRDRLGAFPDDCAPDPAVVASETPDGAPFARRVVEYAVEPGERIRAHLLVPDDPNGAGVLAVHQHAGEFALGKAEPAGLSANGEYHYGRHLAERGYTVLCPDLLCFEERRPPEYARREGSAPDGERYERFEAMDRLLRGSTLQAKYLSDLAVGLDVLEARPAVDAARLGAVGHSLGGQETLWLAWHDDRVAAAVASCGVSRLAAVQRERVVHNFAMYVPGLLADDGGPDVDALFEGVAPTPLFVTNGTDDDIFPTAATDALFEDVAATYEAVDRGDRFEAVTFEGGHGFPAAVRDRAYAFLDDNL